MIYQSLFDNYVFMIRIVDIRLRRYYYNFFFGGVAFFPCQSFINELMISLILPLLSDCRNICIFQIRTVSGKTTQFLLEFKNSISVRYSFHPLMNERMRHFKKYKTCFTWYFLIHNWIQQISNTCIHMYNFSQVISF